MQTKTIRRLVAASFAVIAVAAVTAASFAPSLAPKPAVVGVATGEFVDGVAVYRLPSVDVTVSRSAELAKMAREDALAMTAQAR